MNEALTAQQLLAAGASGALIVLFGAFYAFFFSINLLRPSRYWPIATFASFSLLVACSIVLAIALKLSVTWRLAIGFILICYYFSPHLIWHLSVATHEDEHTVSPNSPLQSDHGGS